MLSRLTLLKTAAKLINTPFLTYYYQLKKNNRLAQIELENIQSNKLNKLVDYVSKKIPFYQERYVNQTFPILSKQELKDAGIEEVTSKKDLIKKTTSGTTGPSFGFYVDRDFFAWELARNLRIFDFAQVELAEPWVLLVPLRDRKNIIFSFLTNRLVLDAAMLSKGRTPLCCPKTNEEQFQPDEQVLQTFFEKIKKHQPKLIYSYPSTLIALGTYLKKWNVKNVKAEKIILSGEVLTNPARMFIEETFRAEVYDLYGTTELPAIAQECPKHHGMHIFTDSYRVEFGEKQEIIITDLDNYAMPFIRYNTNDFGQAKKKKCACGNNFPLMEITQGRVSDLIVAPNGKFLRAGFFTVLIQKNSEVKKLQLIQETQNMLKIYLIADSFSSTRKDYLVHRMNKYVSDSVDIKLEFTDNINMPLKKYFQVYPVWTR
jgi:phenylacetate-CoA ligase